jgi:hypothetical protein
VTVANHQVLVADGGELADAVLGHGEVIDHEE